MIPRLVSNDGREVTNLESVTFTSINGELAAAHNGKPIGTGLAFLILADLAGAHALRLAQAADVTFKTRPGGSA